MPDFTDRYNDNLTPYENYHNAVENLVAAFQYLRDAWDECDDEDMRWARSSVPEYNQDMDFRFETYPFHMSFDELTSEVYAWRDEVDDWYKNLPDELKGNQEYI